VFDTITKLKGDLVNLRPVSPGNVGRIIDVLRYCRIRVLISLRISVVDGVSYGRLFSFLSSNHDTDPQNAILSSEVVHEDDSDSLDIQLIRFTRDIDIKSTDDMVLYLYTDRDCNYTIHSGCTFTMYEI